MELILLIGAGIALLMVGGFLLYLAFAGAERMFRSALAQGFVGIVVYVAAWIFLFPLMLAASLFLGLAGFALGYYVGRASRYDQT